MKKGYIVLNSVISFSVGEQIEVMKPDGENIEVTVKRIVDEEGNDMESAAAPKSGIIYRSGTSIGNV